MIRAGLVLTVLLAGEAMATELYRYHDSAGILVTADTIPPLAAADGYEIVNTQGQVLKVVKAQAPIATDAKSSALDQYLLASFRRVDEVSQRKLQLLDRDIANLQNSLKSLVDRQEQLLAEAASSEMAGESVSADLRKKIQRAQLERTKLDRILAERQLDLAAIEDLYIRYERRLTQLLAKQSASSSN
ncbi:hypothetical protein N9R52_02430 [Porticoccaceae bacterium]|nr:hypothetical protein [Porticoccaceae bacterium]